MRRAMRKINPEVVLIRNKFNLKSDSLAYDLVDFMVNDGYSADTITLEDINDIVADVRISLECNGSLLDAYLDALH